MQHTITPHAIVAQAEAATALPGLAALVRELKQTAAECRERTNVTKAERLDIARQICCYGVKPEVLAELTQLEATRRLQPGYKGGRPYSGKTIAAQELARAAKIPERTICRWLDEWTRIARKLGVETHTDTSIQGLFANGKQPSVAAWFESLEEPEEHDDGNPFRPVTDLESLRAAINHKLESLGEKVGNALMQPRAREVFADAVEAWFGAYGVEVQITFAPRKEKSRR